MTQSPREVWAPKSETRLNKGEDCTSNVILHISRRTLGISQAIWKIKK